MTWRLVFVVVALLLLGCQHFREISASPGGAPDAAKPTPVSATAPFDILIRNARVIDGTGTPWFNADVGIRAGKIASLGFLNEAPATLVIDAAGRVVCPGFIDVHTHADEDLYRFPRAENFIRGGVTTIVTGNCGGSPSNVAEYLGALERRGVALNVATLYGHNTILRAVKGDVAGELSAEQMQRARGLIDQAMRDGAVGLSTGLIYTPGRWSSTEEIIELAKVAGSYGGIYASHLRSEGGGIMAAIDEALRIGREAGCRVQISHFKLPTDYAERVGGSDATLARVMAARDAGMEVWLDQYPYTASSTTITTLLPDDLLEAGAEAARRRLTDPEQLQAVLERMRKQHEEVRGRKSMAFAVIASCRAHPQYVGKNLQQVALMRKLPPGTQLVRDGSAATTEPVVTMEDQYRAIIDIYLSGGATCVFHTMDEKQVENIMRHPLVSIASDAGVRQFGSGAPHPRGYGTNARVLGRYVRERKLLTLQEAIRKMTAMPAVAFRFADRGLLREGFAADVLILDPERVIDRATFEQPHAYSEGIDWVIVNGVVVLREGEMTAALPGRAIRGPGWQPTP